jgi:nucleoside 2-deoxyribosyltransferase
MTKTHRVYCAGPLFNQSERDEMTAIANALRDEGFAVYLPHSDGMEFRLVHHCLTSRGWEPALAAKFLHQAIFALDVFQLVSECDSVVWNLNGRVPDEGAVSEAAIAWTLGKPMIAYKDDVRSLITGRDNPLLVGLVDFEVVRSLAEIVPALREQIATAPATASPRLPKGVSEWVERGRRLWAAMREHDATGDSAAIADFVAELFAPENMPTPERSSNRTPALT